MMDIAKKLENWAKENLITIAQQKAILAYETKRKNRFLLFALLLLGGLCCGLGLISLTAFNWQHISSAVKLLVYIILQLAIGAAAVFSFLNKRQFLYETLLFVSALLLFSGITLIDQIYQFSAHSSSKLLLWAVLSAPLLPFTRCVWLPFLWLPTLFFSLFEYLYAYPWFSEAFQSLARQYPDTFEFCQILACVSLYGFFSKGKMSNHQLTKALGWWTLLAIVIYAIGADFLGYEIFAKFFAQTDAAQASNGLNRFLLWFLLAMLAGAVSWFNIGRGNKYWSLALLVILGFSLLAQFFPNNETVFGVWGVLQSMSLLSVAVVYAYQTNRLGLLKGLIVIIAIRFGIIYLQVFGNLLSTGLGLVAAGIILFVVSCLWLKKRR